MNNDKPVYTIDLFPSIKRFGINGFIYCIVFIILIFLLGFTEDMMVSVTAIVIAAFAFLSGREFEAAFYKDVLAHMPQKIQDLFKQTAMGLAKKGVEDHKNDKTDSDTS